MLATSTRYYSLDCTRPVAVDSPDHTHPRGTRNDNSVNPLFNRKLERLLPARRPLRVLDLGCAGGGFVKSLIDAGHEAVGLEGSDYSQQRQRAEWATIPGNLFTCDVTRPFTIHEPDCLARFDVVTGWEFFEHIAPENIAAVMANVHRHAAADALCIFSISPYTDAANGVVYHQTIQPREWWVAEFASLGWTDRPELVSYFGDDWVRGPLQGAMSFHVVLTREGGRIPPPPTGDVLAPGEIRAAAEMFAASGARPDPTGGSHNHAEYARRLFARASER